MTRSEALIDCATLLRHLSCEFSRLADTADAVQQGAAQMASLQPQAGEHGEWLMVRLQALDSLAQVLRDLQRLASAAAVTPLGCCCTDPAFVRRNILLQSLAERLIAGPGHDDGHDGTAFLL